MFRHFFPKHGLLSQQVEPLADRGSFASGENRAQWKGLSWKGRPWDFSLGAFHVDSALQPLPFTNLTQPNFYLRGGSVTARTSNWRYSFYAGSETLSQGPRIPFREKVSQSAIGIEAAAKETTHPENLHSKNSPATPLETAMMRMPATSIREEAR